MTNRSKMLANEQIELLMEREMTTYKTNTINDKNERIGMKRTTFVT